MNKPLQVFLLLILLSAVFVPIQPARAQLCELPPLFPLDPLIITGDIRASVVANSAFDHIGPYNFYGRSLLLGLDGLDGPRLAIINLNIYEDYPPGMIPDIQILPLTVAGLSSIALIERVIGRENPDALHPSELNFHGDPLLVVAESDAIYIRTLADTLVSSHPMLEFGLGPGWGEAIAFDNDGLRLFMVNNDAGLLAAIQFFFNGDPPELAFPPVPLTPEILGNPITNASFVPGSQLLMLQGTLGEILYFVDVSVPTSPLLHSSLVLDPGIVTVAASPGYCELNAGIGQLVGVSHDILEGTFCVTSPCAPVAPDCVPALTAMPVYGTYLEPVYGMSFAYDHRESHTGTLEIRGHVEGPWWPASMQAAWSTDDFFYFTFATDESGIQTPEITFGSADILGDGWHVQYEPTNEDEECTWIRLCYEIQTENGTLVYVQDSIKAQDAMKPEIADPAQDGDIVDADQEGEGEVQHPDPDQVDETKIERREVENDVSDEIDGIPQEREGLPVWWFGEGEDRVCIEGGAHCAPTAAVQNIIAHAEYNECLCKKLNCYLGNGPDGDDCNFDDDEITELILTMGIAMETNKHECGSIYGDAAKAIEKFLKIICLESMSCVDCDHNLYSHMIPSGNRGDALDWEDIVEEMGEKDQSIMLRLTHTNEDGSTSDHRVSLKEIDRQVGPCVTITIADPDNGGVYLLEVNTTTMPPTIKDDDYWDSITGAIALSDSTEEEEEEDRAGSSLDELHTWELVQYGPGASTTFPLENLTPGFWKYRVRTYFDGDSADAFRQIYVPESREVVALRVGDDLHLNWRSDPRAVNYLVEYSDDQGDTWLPLSTVADTSLVTAYTDSDLRLFRVRIDFTAP